MYVGSNPDEVGTLHFTWFGIFYSDLKNKAWPLYPKINQFTQDNMNLGFSSVYPSYLIFPPSFCTFIQNLNRFDWLTKLSRF